MKDIIAATKEIKILLLVVLVFTVAMVGLFGLFGIKDSSIRYGAALGFICCVINLILIKISYQKTEGMTDTEAAERIRSKYARIRLLVICFFFYTGFSTPVFNKVAIILPFLFPRIAAMVIQFIFPSWENAYKIMFDKLMELEAKLQKK